MLWRFLTIVALFSVGCAHRGPVQNMMPVPEPGTREALLPTYKPTGSVCLDSISANMLYMGCSQIEAVSSGDTIFVGCAQAQPGAQDVFSQGTFVRILEPEALPDGAEPFCGDPTGVYAMWGMPFSELRRNE